MTRLTRRYRFPASHRLHVPSLTEEENLELYGKCSNPHGHGHNYELEVSVRGDVDRATGMLVRIEDLDRLVNAEVLRDFGHRNLNCDVPEFQNLVPTTENLAAVVERRLSGVWDETLGLSGLKLDRILIRETRNNSVEWKS